MIGIGSLGFLAPWLLIGLAALPLLWWLLRAVPPAPLRRRFPAVTLLLGLADKETTPDRTPWWLLLLRMLAVAAAILAFAQPILNPTDRIAGKGPLVIAMDASWASAQSWDARQSKVSELLTLAEQDGRPVALIRLSDTPRGNDPLAFGSAAEWLNRSEGLQPNAWEPQYDLWQDVINAGAGFETVWVSDGLARDARDTLMMAFEAQGNVAVIQSQEDVLALRTASVEDGKLVSTALRLVLNPATQFQVIARGPDPAGIERNLAQGQAAFGVGKGDARIEMDPPSELRNRVKRLQIEGVRSAGATVVTDDSIQRRKVALIGGGREQEGAVLVSPLHFLRKALVPTAEVIEAGLGDSLKASPDVVILADVGELAVAETQAVQDWVEAGGLLVRFAGPRLASSGIGQKEEHVLLPVRLRAGGRSVGGTMSWGAPKKLAAFDRDSPFFGLILPSDIEVKSQVVAQPDPTLSERVLANLQDGTPLVTGKDLGAGRVVLFHVTANADWSNLPLSGLFVQLLERLAVSTRSGELNAEELTDFVWVAQQVLDGFGVLRDAPNLAGISGERLASGVVGPDMPPGVYKGGERRIAVNAIAPDRMLRHAAWPVGTRFITLEQADERPLQAWFLIAALALLCLDILATLWIGGRLSRRSGSVVSTGFATLIAVTIWPVGPAHAQNEAALLEAANNTVLAYVETGNPRLDTVSDAGLRGLSAELFRRTSIEPINPVSVNLATADLSLYPFLYWPVTDTQRVPSDLVMDKLNGFLRNGGMILFDTRDANISRGFGSGTPNGRVLQQIAERLDVPPLEPIPQDHVLTRAFYLLQDFPGRFANTDVWVEAAPPDAELVEGMPFRNLNDGVSPVVIGGNDWASAWAVQENGRFMFPVGRGSGGERQREIAFRFGVNLIMHVLTGNYKSDQVHIPALLDRLGN